MSIDLQAFAERFTALNAHNLAPLAELYHPDVVFQDPLHRVRGLAALQAYFAELYANVTELRFEFLGLDVVSDTQGYLRWTMQYRHPRRAGGQLVCVEGCSHLVFCEQKVISHRDYFDAGALLYEHVPLLGRLIRWLKGRLA